MMNQFNSDKEDDMVTQPQAPVGISIPAIGVGLQPETANPAETNTITAFHTIGFVKVGSFALPKSGYSLPFAIMEKNGSL